MKAIGIIPSRYGSTRLPAKSLALLNGKPLVQHVYERAKQARTLDDVIVATDDERILRAVVEFGGKAVITGSHHRSGTERVAEVARQSDARVILNVQGDEPLIHPEQIDQVASFLMAHHAVPMATVMTPLSSAEAPNPNIVKVVVDQDGSALYFSRAPIPFIRAKDSSGLRAEGSGQLPRAQSPEPRAYKHIGLYGYQRHFLLQFPYLPQTPLEQLEQLEQLRALEHGHRIKVLTSPYDTIGVDTADDLQRAEMVLNP